MSISHPSLQPLVSHPLSSLLQLKENRKLGDRVTLLTNKTFKSAEKRLKRVLTRYLSRCHSCGALEALRILLDPGFAGDREHPQP